MLKAIKDFTRSSKEYLSYNSLDAFDKIQFWCMYPVALSRFVYYSITDRR